MVGKQEGSEQALWKSGTGVLPVFVCLFVLRQGLSGCPGTSSVDQIALKFTEIRPPLPPECWV